MSDAEHARYVKLLNDFYHGGKVDLAELSRLHKLNMARVNLIVTGSREEEK